MHLHELMGWSGPMTDRQYNAWLNWLDADMNNPSRADYYAMMVAQASGAKNVQPIVFRRKSDKISEEAVAIQVVEAKARAIMRCGGVYVTKVLNGNDGTGS